MATKNQTRPSFARVKVEVDLLSDFPKRINIRVRKQSGVKIWVQINYDHIPKYCANYRLQGHIEHECYALHP
uniref:Putative ovule protein n=1 Tax=Solanum chacoense TaxID=4108 RepID=A0A0V0GMA7_SOLCH